MVKKMSPLPQLLPYDGMQDFQEYLDNLHTLFDKEILHSHLAFNGKLIYLLNRTLISGKYGTFWHVISGDSRNPSSAPDTARCQYVPYIAYIIRNASSLNSWHEISHTKGRNKNRVCIALKDFSYLVILEFGNKQVYLVTAYPIEFESRKRKVKKRFEEGSHC
jgi:hypothetical protein